MAVNGLTLDGATKDPIQQAVRGSLIASWGNGSSSAEIIKEAQKAGIAHAQAHDDGMKYVDGSRLSVGTKPLACASIQTTRPDLARLRPSVRLRIRWRSNSASPPRNRDHELAVGCVGVTQRFDTARFHDSVEGIQKITS
jgi:hypothetical protein